MPKRALPQETLNLLREYGRTFCCASYFCRSLDNRVIREPRSLQGLRELKPPCVVVYFSAWPVFIFHFFPCPGNAIKSIAVTWSSRRSNTIACVTYISAGHGILVACVVIHGINRFGYNRGGFSS